MRCSVRQIIVACLVLAGLSACAPRPGPEVLTPYEPAPRYTNKVELLVATSRGRNQGDDLLVFTAERAHELSYASMTVSIPKSHVPGKIEWPDTGGPDPQMNFMTTEGDIFETPEFLNRIRARARAGGHEANSVLVFIHGYNNRYQESVYRFAQIVHDSGYQGTAVLFAWPSRGKAPLYLADRESAAYSRDYLEKALQQIAALSEVHEINILAHSMGNWLAMETLRQAAMKGHRDFNGKLGNVVLASPDIDVNVFRTQLDVIGPLRKPMTILVSEDDKALAIARAFAGGIDRVGEVAAGDPRAIRGAKRYNLRVVDLTELPGQSNSNHIKFAESDAVLHAIGRGLAGEAKAKPGVFDAVVDAGTSILKVPAAVVGVPVE